MLGSFLPRSLGLFIQRRSFVLPRLKSEVKSLRHCAASPTTWPHHREEAGADIIAAAAVAVAARRTTGGSNVHSSPSVRPPGAGRPACHESRPCPPVQPLPPDDGVDGRRQEGGRGKERRLAVAGLELEATLEEEDWPGLNLVGVREGGRAVQNTRAPPWP